MMLIQMHSSAAELNFNMPYTCKKQEVSEENINSLLEFSTCVETTNLLACFYNDDSWQTFACNVMSTFKVGAHVLCLPDSLST